MSILHGTSADQLGNAYSAYTDFLRDLGLLIDIDLEEFNFGMQSGQLLEDGGDDTARATPRSPEVKDCHGALVDL